MSHILLGTSVVVLSGGSGIFSIPAAEAPVKLGDPTVGGHPPLPCGRLRLYDSPNLAARPEATCALI